MKAGRAVTPIMWLLLALVALPGGCPVAFGQDKKPAPATPDLPAQAPVAPAAARFAIKTSEVSVPAGVPIGKYRRVIEPHLNWTLICDENLQDKKRVCNISQQITDQKGEIVFSWSLAGTEDGMPILILRVPSALGKGTAIRLSFTDKNKPINVATSACDLKVCVGMLPVGPRLKTYIRAGADIDVSYSAKSAPSSKIAIRTTFAGLSDALAAI